MPGESILLTPPCLSLQMLRAHYVHSSQHHLSSGMPSPRSCMHCCSAGSSPGSMPWCLHIRTCCPSPSWTSMASRWHFVCVGGAGDIKLHLSHFSAYGATIIRAPFPYYFLSCLLPFSSLTHTVRHYLRPDRVLGNTRDPGKDQTWDLLLGRFQEGLGGDGRQKLTNIFGQSHNRGSLELEEPRENP